jgi:hypothetical protein
VKLAEADELAAGAVEHRAGVRLLPDVVPVVRRLRTTRMNAASFWCAESKVPSNPIVPSATRRRVPGTVRASSLHSPIPAELSSLSLSSFARGERASGRR